jgi:hypothetical protein
MSLEDPDPVPAPSASAPVIPANGLLQIQLKLDYPPKQKFITVDAKCTV